MLSGVSSGWGASIYSQEAYVLQNTAQRHAEEGSAQHQYLSGDDTENCPEEGFRDKERVWFSEVVRQNPFQILLSGG